METITPVPMANTDIGFLLHALIELPAAVTFFLLPSRQLGTHSPHAHAIIRQYAMLLYSSILIALVFVRRPQDQLQGQVAGALALYHIGPAARSASSIRHFFSAAEPVRGASGSLWEPVLYVVVHVTTGTMLARTCWSAYLSPSAS